MLWRSVLERPDGVKYVVREKLTETTERELFLRARASQGDIPLSAYTNTGSWAVAPAVLRAHTPIVNPVGEMSATLSRLLAQDDSGIVPGVYDARFQHGPACSADS